MSEQLAGKSVGFFFTTLTGDDDILLFQFDADI